MADDEQVETPGGADASLEPGFDPNWGKTEVEAEDVPEKDETEGKESEAESPPADEENVEEKTPPKEDGFQKRIDELTRNWRQEQRERQELEQQLKEAREAASKVKPDVEVKTLADFDYDESKFQSYLFEQAEKRAEAAAERKLSSFESERQAEKRENQFRQAEEKAFSEIKDYMDVVYGVDAAGNRKWEASDVMASEIQASEIGPEIAYYLGKNPDIASNIARMPERTAVREMTRLESKLQGEKQRAVEERKRVSKAPPPPDKIAGKDAAPRVDPTDPASDKLSDKDWFKREEARLAKLRG